MRDGGESFENFRLDFYSAEPGPDPRRGLAEGDDAPRLRDLPHLGAGPLALVAELIFRGGPGLGKTFLSACIAREAAARGFSVAYESAPAALGEFEKERFSRDAAEAAAAAAKVREYMGLRPHDTRRPGHGDDDELHRFGPLPARERAARRLAPDDNLGRTSTTPR